MGAFGSLLISVRWQTWRSAVLPRSRLRVADLAANVRASFVLNRATESNERFIFAMSVSSDSAQTN